MSNETYQDALNDIIDILIFSLQDNSADIRRHAASFLGKIGNKVGSYKCHYIIDALRKALDDENADVKITVLKALIDLGEIIGDWHFNSKNN